MNLTVEELHYGLEQRIDRLSTQFKIDLNVGEKDFVLNEAQRYYIKTIHQQVENALALAPLVTERTVIPTSVNATQWRIDLNTLDPSLFILSQIEVGIKGCPFPFKGKHALASHIRQLLEDPFNRPSEEFVLYTYNENAIDIFALKPVDTVTLRYIREPKRVSMGTYVHLDGITYPKQGFDIHATYEPEVLDLAAVLVSQMTENTTRFQLDSARLQVHTTP